MPHRNSTAAFKKILLQIGLIARYFHTPLILSATELLCWLTVSTEFCITTPSVGGVFETHLPRQRAAVTSSVTLTVHLIVCFMNGLKSVC